MVNSSSLFLGLSGIGGDSLFRIPPRAGLLQCRASICQCLRLNRRISSPNGSLRFSSIVFSGGLWRSLEPGRGSDVRIRCKAASASGGEAPPESREEAIEQAAGSISALLEKVLKRQGPSTVKQKKEQRQVKLRVEIPVLDETPSSLVSLTLDLLSALIDAKRDPPTVAVFFSNSSAVDLAQEQCTHPKILKKSFRNLKSERNVPGDASVVLVAGAKFEDNADLEELARNATPRPIVILNPEWSPEDEKEATWSTLLTSFEAAYVFFPLVIQGLFSKTEGAVLKNVQSGAPGGRPWLIFVKEGGKFSRLSSLQRRPGPAELESALYNAMAANSPVTKSIKFLKGLVSKE